MELHEYIEKEKLPIVLLAINNIQEKRFNQYCPYTSGEFSVKTLGYKRNFIPEGDLYVSWIMEEVLPIIAKHNQLKFNSITMAGISLGALISMYALLKYPHQINNVISISGAYYINLEAMESLINNSQLPNNHIIYLDYGTTEDPDNEHISSCFIESNRRILTTLSKQDSSLKFNEFKNHGHDYKFFNQRMKDSIASLFQS